MQSFNGRASLDLCIRERESHRAPSVQVVPGSSDSDEPVQGSRHGVLSRNLKDVCYEARIHLAYVAVSVVALAGWHDSTPPFFEVGTASRQQTTGKLR